MTMTAKVNTNSVFTLLLTVTKQNKNKFKLITIFSFSNILNSYSDSSSVLDTSTTTNSSTCHLTAS